MVADRADVRCLGPDDQVTAVAALPDLYAALFKDGLLLDVLQQFAVALFMRLLDGGDTAEFLRELREAFLFGFLRHALVHVGPLKVLALCRVQQVLLGAAELIELLEPELGMLLLVLGGLQEERGDLLVAGLLGDGCEVGVLVSCLALASNGLPDVLLGFCACIPVCLVVFLLL